MDTPFLLAGDEPSSGRPDDEAPRNTAVPADWRERAAAKVAEAERARERHAAAALWLEAARLHAAHDPATALDLAERALALAPGLRGALDLLEEVHGAHRD